MPAPTNRWVDPNNLPQPSTVNGHLIIPFPAVRGLVRALLTQWDISDADRTNLESLVTKVATSLSDPRCIKGCEQDLSDGKIDSINWAALEVTTAIKGLLRPCPTEMLRVQAQGLDSLLEAFPFAPTNLNHAVLWLRECFPEIQLRVSRSSVCNVNRIHPTNLPDDEALYAWAKSESPAALRNKMLAYLHGISSAYLAQLLAGRTN